MYINTDLTPISEKMYWVIMSVFLGSIIGCANLAETKLTYLEIWLENASDVKVSSVAIGQADQCSDLGLLGSKGAKKVAVVPVQFIRDYQVTWEEGFDGKERKAMIDLRRFEGVKNRAITVRYKGDAQWEAELGREIRPSTNK